MATCAGDDGTTVTVAAIIVADATGAAGDAAYEAALTNYEFLAHEVVTAAQIIKRLKAAKK